MRSICVALCVVSLISSARADVGVADQDLTFAVDLRPGVSVDIHVRVFVDETRGCPGPAVLAVHGLTHTAASWAPFAEALFAAGGPCRVYALDLPGHGGSGLPRGLRFGGLLIEDYTTAVLRTLQRLQRQGAAVRVVVGHSMGGLVIQQLQVRLRWLGSDLAALGIVDAVLISSATPAEVVAMQCGNHGGAPSVPASYLRADATRGIHLAIPDDAWRSLFFSDRTGTVVPSAPDLADVVAYNAFEPLLVVLQLVGQPPFARPSVPAGVFAGGRVALTVAAFEEDAFGTEADQRCLLDHLAGAGRDLVVVTGPEAVHDAHVAVPGDVVAALAGAF